MKCIKVIITGHVQGIFFRSNIRDLAYRHNVKGYVRNMPDGSVEACLYGEDRDVHILLDYCKKGPSLARIKDIEVKECKEEFKGFEIRY